MTMNYKGFYTKKGMTQAVDRTQDGNYKKGNLTEEQITNFKIAEKLQIGVCIEKINEKEILMNGGIVLNRYLKEWRRRRQIPPQKIYYKNGILHRQITMVSYNGPDFYLSNRELIEQLDKIMEIMRKNMIAHTDIKPQNLVVIERAGAYYSSDEKQFKHKCYRQRGLYLIDNDSIRPYGSVRLVGTPYVNCHPDQLNKIQIVDENTDKMGYNSVVSFIKSFHGPEKNQ